METRTYTIPEDRREEVEKLVQRYQRKAARYGVVLEVRMGKPYAEKVRYWRGNDIVHEEMIEAFDLEIEGEEIRNGNYSVVAKLEHLENGNIVTTFGVEADKSWKHLGCHCDHCNTNRDRKLTFIVRDGNGNQKQVGKTCLKDYCGIDPNGIGYSNELRDVFLDYDISEVRDYDPDRPVGNRVYDTVEMLGLAISIVKEAGYVKSTEFGSNKYKMMARRNDWRMTEAERKEAEAMANGIAAMTDEETAFTVLGNVKTLVKGGYCKVDHFGYIAYAPLAWRDYQQKLEEQRRREAEAEAMRGSSDYIGSVGQRLTVSVMESKLITSWETDYGMTHLYRFVDTDGNVLVWFASKMIDENDISKLTGTVKAHSERDGIKQTVMTRCKVA